MRRYYIVLIMNFLLMGSAYGYGAYSPVITKIENSFYGIDYAEQTDEKRLERLEETVYGEAKKGDVKTRVKKLSQDISADLIGKEINPSVDTFMDNSPKKIEDEVVADSSANYPVIDTMEEIIFKKNYKTSDVKNRITKLEQEVFKQVYPSEDLYTRVERLKASILIEENKYLGYTPTDSYQSDYPTEFEYDNYTPSYPRRKSVKDYMDTRNSGDLNVAVGALEKSILKKNYPNETTQNRISRMENKLFSTEFSEDDEQTRLNRLASAHNAQKSAKKYDNNKFTQNMSTFMQIGMTVLMILAMVL